MTRMTTGAILALILLANCSQADQAITLIPPSATAEPPVVTPTLTAVIPPTPSVTPIPTAAPAPQSTPVPVFFADSGQRLGAARSWDTSLGDLDGDGDLDAFVANESPTDQGNAVWLNDGQGHFVISEQNIGHGMGVELGDLDGDGDLDAFITSWHQASTVWLNNGGVQDGTPGTYSDSGQSLGSPDSWDVALGDLDGDGDLDALIAKTAANTVWLNEGGLQGGTPGIFTDTGQRLGAAYTAAVDLGDLDGDGDLDALTVGWDEPGRVWLNDSAGVLTDSGQTLTPGYVHIHGLALGDLDGDDDLDAFLAGAPNQVWLNDGAGAFSESEQGLVSRAGDTVALGDLDGDGDLDAFLAVGDWSGSDDKLWLNDGDGRLTDSGLPLSETFSSGLGLGDLDGDGDMDAFVTHGDLGKSSGGEIPNEVWLNMTPSPEAALTSSATPAVSLTHQPISGSRAPISPENAADVVQLRSAEMPGFLEMRETCGVAFSPDGDHLAAACRSTLIPLWDVGTGQLVRTFGGGGYVWASVAFSPDGRFLASSGQGRDIALWDISTGERVRKIEGGPGYMSKVAFSPDGQQLVSGSFLGSALLWDMETGVPLVEFFGHHSRVNCVHFSPDGSLIVSGGGDNKARVWETSSGEETLVLSGATHFIEDVEFDPTGLEIVGASDNSRIYKWDAVDGDLIQTFRGHTGPVNGVTYSPAGRLIASASNDRTIRLWDAHSGEILARLEGHSDLAIRPAFNPDGSLIASVSWDGTVILWGLSES